MPGAPEMAPRPPNVRGGPGEPAPLNVGAPRGSRGAPLQLLRVRSCGYFGCFVSVEGFADVSVLVSDFTPVLALVSDFAPESLDDGELVLGEAAGLLIDGAAEGAAEVLDSTPSLAEVSPSSWPVAFRPCFCW